MQERPDEASYRIETFTADEARRTGSTPGAEGESAERDPDEPEKPPHGSHTGL